MTQLEILDLAWKMQLNVWANEKEILNRYPEDEMTKTRERETYEKVMILARMIEKEEEKTA